MSTPIQITAISPFEFVAPLSRYENSTVLLYSENNLITFNTYKKQEFVPSDADQFTVITHGQQYRPDLVSQSFYGIPDLWWKIMEVNEISDILEFTAGRTVRLPANVF